MPMRHRRFRAAIAVAGAAFAFAVLYTVGQMIFDMYQTLGVFAWGGLPVFVLLAYAFYWLMEQ